MKKATLVLPIILISMAVCGYGIDLKSYGFDVTNTRHENNQTVYTIAAPSGFAFTVSTTSPLTDANAKVLQSVMSTLGGWRSLKIAQAKVVFDGNRADILVLPASFDYRGVDLSRYMPSGMQFYYDSYLQYDFRMLKDNLFLRLKGEVYDEKQFVDRLYTAVENPVLFLQTNNPEYLLERLASMQQKLDSLATAFQEQKMAISDAEKRLTQKIDAIASQERNWVSQQQALNTKQENFNQKQESFNAKQEGFNAKQQSVNVSVQKELAAIKEQNALIADELDHVRYSLIVLNNRGFFGTIHPIDKKAIDRVVAMKKADPSLTLNQVLVKLKSEGIKMSKKEVSLVFDVYFNEFK